MALTIKKTHAHLNGGINVRNELHGQEDVGACDFKLSQLMLDEEMIDELYDQKGYYKSLFKKGGSLAEPITRRNDPISFNVKFEKSTITLWLDGAEESVKFSECKLRKIQLDPQTGGAVEMSVQVQANPDSDELGMLYTHQNKDCSVSLRFGKEEKPKSKAQPELPLGTTGTDENGEETPAVH
jgi:hypothetical protein